MTQLLTVFNEMTSQPTSFSSKSGLAFAVRPVRDSDQQLLIDVLQGLSARTCLLRYFSPMPGLSRETAQREVARMIRHNPNQQITLVATLQTNEAEKVIAVAEITRLSQQTVAEIAVVVSDKYQREGIGSVILKQLIELARSYHISRIQATILAENIPMQRLINKLNLSYTYQTFASERLISMQL